MNPTPPDDPDNGRPFQPHRREDPTRRAAREFTAVPVVAGLAIAGAAAYWGHHNPRHTAPALALGFLGIALATFARLFTRGNRS